MHPGDLAGGFCDLEMTWLLYCAGAATGQQNDDLGATALFCFMHGYACVSLYPVHGWISRFSAQF